MKITRFGVVVLAASGLVSCATITRGTRQKLTILSEPPGAAVEATNGLFCTTPCNIKVRRKSDFVVRVAKPGYETAEVRVRGKLEGGGIAGGVVGNAVLAGVIGIGVDASTGAMLNLVPNPVQVTLKPLASAASTAPAPILTRPSVPSSRPGATPRR